MPAVGDALQLVLASNLEGEAGTRNLWPTGCVPSLDGTIQRAIGVALGLVVVGVLGFALHDQPGSRPYSSVEALGRDINAHGVGCSTVQETRAGERAGEDMAVCVVGSATITLHTYDGVSWLQRLRKPSPSSIVTWVVGPN
jgi:hypothetical protein